MSTSNEHIISPLGAFAQLRRSAVLTWLELPRVIVVGLAWITFALPLLTSAFGAPWLLDALAGLPACLYATGLVKFAAIVARAERPRVLDAFRLDVVLGFTLWVAGLIVVFAIEILGRVGAIAGVVLAAILLLVAPFTLAYGAIRGRTGFAAWRGGLILVGYRPGAALSVLSLNCLGGFAIVATLGVLGVFVPVFLLAFACSLVSAQLNDIDHRSSPGSR